MSSFIVLGLIPGTNIQVTFSMWLAAISAVLLLVTLRLLRQQIVAWRIAFAVFSAARSAQPFMFGTFRL
ncbi:MAG TPA: hypothetical protein VLI54_03390 [Bacillota bacterium]|nr:hypothetical protein [Bacillota bacterium]